MAKKSHYESMHEIAALLPPEHRQNWLSIETEREEFFQKAQRREISAIEFEEHSKRLQHESASLISLVSGEPISSIYNTPMTSDSLRSPPAEETEKNAVPPIIKAIHYTALGVLIFSIFLGIYAAKSSGRGDASAEVFFTIFSLYIPTYVLYAEFKGRIFFPMGPQLFTNKSDGIIYFRIEQAAYMVFPLALILKQILN